MKFENPVKFLRDLKTKPELYWFKRGETMVLSLFHAMAKRVPAYADFLKKHKIFPSRIKTLKDFENVPLLDKEKYIKNYPLQDLCWDGKFSSRRYVIAATSGSTGESTYFPRGEDQDWQYAFIAELYLRTNFQIHRKSTLYVNGFALGVWIGGLFTYQALALLAKRGNYRLSVVNPGLNKIEIIKAIRNLGRYFDQVILGGYPPFVKDVLDEGSMTGVKWARYNLKFVFSAEGFSEKFRDYIAKKAGLRDIYRDTLNHYGTVDLGTMSYETPVSILVRRLALGSPKISQTVFPDIHRLPTLTQFLPELFYFEENKGNLICSAVSGIPLVRYDLKDRGGVFTFNELVSSLGNQDVDLRKEIRKAGIADSIWKLPFVYVYERSDFVVSLYGANIYPEHIREVFLKKELAKFVTGKFTMEVKFGRLHDSFLLVNSELKRNVKATKKVSTLIQEAIIKVLLKRNSEFQNNYTLLPKRNTPKIKLFSYESEPYFKPGGKQKWSLKTKYSARIY